MRKHCSDFRPTEAPCGGGEENSSNRNADQELADIDTPSSSGQAPQDPLDCTQVVFWVNLMFSKGRNELQLNVAINDLMALLKLLNESQVGLLFFVARAK